MDQTPLHSVLRHLRLRAAPASDDGLLLARFADDRDEAAFEDLVRRHGPLVWAVCRARLQPADAEDAFQATFVVLARRAAHVRKPASLACWLSGVARRVVHAAHRRSARRRTTRLPADLPAADDRDRLEWREALSGELDRLPEKYRLPVILCYYQGLTNEEAAARLAWPPGTVRGRLARARDLLRRRLARRGLTLGAGALAVAADPPSELLATTFRISTRLSAIRLAGDSLVGTVIQLAEDVMHAIWVEKVKAWLIGAVVLAGLGGTTGWFLVSAPAQPRPAPSWSSGEPAPPAARAVDPPLRTPEDISAAFSRLQAVELKPSALAEAVPADDEIRKLRKEAYRSAHHECRARLDAFQAGTVAGTIDLLLTCVTKRLLPAEVALSDRSADHLAAAERALAILKWVEAVNDRRFQEGRIPVQDRERSRHERIEMEIKVIEAKRLDQRRLDR